MTSIRKTKKALKRKIRRIDAVAIELAKHEGTASAMWDLFLWRNYFERKIKYVGKEEPNPWTGEGITRFTLNESEQSDLLNLIKGIR